jgi:hypothetical protein
MSTQSVINVGSKIYVPDDEQVWLAGEVSDSESTFLHTYKPSSLSHASLCMQMHDSSSCTEYTFHARIVMRIRNP